MVTSSVVGLSEIATLFRVTKRTALRYSKRTDFPAPIERLAVGPVWGRAEVEAWAGGHLPLPAGRPKGVPEPSRKDASTP